MDEEIKKKLEEMQVDSILENPDNGRKVKISGGSLYRYTMIKVYVISGMTNDVDVATKFLIGG